MKDDCVQKETRLLGLPRWPLVLGMSVTAVALLLLSGCAKENSDTVVTTITVAPTHYEYSEEFLDLAAEEVGVLGNPCERQIIDAECSALLRLVLDYGRVREQIREIEGD